MNRPRRTPARKPRISNRRAFHEGVDRLIESVGDDYCPDANEIPKLGINDFKRLNLILSPDGKKKLRKKLSARQLATLPSGIL